MKQRRHSIEGRGQMLQQKKPAKIQFKVNKSRNWVALSLVEF